MSKLTTLFGPPGTGKTTTLSKWAKQASDKYGGENILICSLTKTAATEIGSRDTSVPRENIGTLHAHAYRAIEDGPKVMQDEDIDEFNESWPEYAIPKLQKAADDTWTSGAGNSSYLSMYDLLRARRVTKFPTGLLQFIELYEGFKSRRHVIDFTDMIQYAIDNVDCPAKYIIMDEAQDCSALEFQLLSKWAAQTEGAVIAGDDDQAAYEWRGASVDAFLGFSEDHRVLNQTYRLPLKVKGYADGWIHQIGNRKEKKYLHRPGSEGKAVEVDFRNPEEVLDHLSSQEGTSMVLSTCGFQTLPFVRLLRERALPFWNPYRLSGDYASTWNPLSSGGRARVTSSDSIRAFLSPPWTWSAAQAWMQHLKDLPRGSKKLLDHNKHNDELMPTETLSTILGGALSAALTGDLDWYIGALKNDAELRAKMLYRARIAKRFGVAGLTEKPKVIVGTIHSVKGGEADNVYLLPDLSAKGKEAWQVTADKNMIIRQMYIGMTRAKENLFLLRPARYSIFQWDRSW